MHNFQNVYNGEGVAVGYGINLFMPLAIKFVQKSNDI
jgi:hypothetical protein